MKLGRRKKRLEAVVELNITAFMNLMVILVPFLLITAVFSRMTVLELNLPPINAKPAEAKNEDEKFKLQLQVLVTPETLVIQDPKIGVLGSPISLLENGEYIDDAERKVWRPFSNTLLEIKRRYPEEDAITLLLDRKVEYKLMIAVMDHVKSMDTLVAGTFETVALFPTVSIGDLPEAVIEAPSGDQPQESASAPEGE